MDGLLIILVNFRTPDLTLDCLRSIAAERSRTTPPVRVCLIDNGSGDDSADRLRNAIAEHAWSDWVDFIAGTNNLGFAGGNNAAIREAWRRDVALGRERAPLVLLLNSDTIVHDGCLARCFEVMRSDDRIGAMSCRLLNADGSLQVVSRKFQSPLRLILGQTGLPWKLPSLMGWARTEYSGWDMNTQPGDPEWIGGAFLLVRTAVLDQIGLLDEGFFFYGEDMEFCHRIRRAGFRIHYDPVGTTTHFGGSSSDPTRMLSERRQREMWRARYLFLRRSYGAAAMWLVRAVDAIALSGRSLAHSIRGSASSIAAESVRVGRRQVLGRLGPW
jgi:N-acetylglucosaminyl-diphospho-decaprenol L-rhamnosyltransferase